MNKQQQLFSMTPRQNEMHKEEMSVARRVIKDKPKVKDCGTCLRPSFACGCN